MKFFYLNHLSFRQCFLFPLALFLGLALPIHTLHAQCSSVSDMITITANTGMPIAIDVNGDGIPDFSLSYTYFENAGVPFLQSVSLVGLNGHTILISSGQNVEAVGFGDDICANETYNPSVNLYDPIQNAGLAFGSGSGAWVGLMNGSNIGFMFIQVTAISDTEVTISYNSYGMGMGSNIPVCNGDGAIVGDCNSISVPVELSLFEGKLMNYGMQLRWQTESEIQNAGFYLERSLDGKNFTPIHWVEGYGNSLVQREYIFHDMKLPVANQYYYRLQQVDKDGTTEYSDIIVIGSPEDKMVLSEAYPNPTKEEAWLNLTIPESTNAIISTYDLSGAMHTSTIVDLSSGENVLPIPIPKNASDVLLVKIQIGDRTLLRRVTLINE